MSWTDGVRFPAEADNFSLLYIVEIESGVHPASYPVANVDSPPGRKATEAASWPFTSVHEMVLNLCTRIIL
jgi:hypothetical protein